MSWALVTFGHALMASSVLEEPKLLWERQEMFAKRV
eukprot:SAG22_NODE_10521_length_530_cov_0.721578_1_plen_35_part_10